MARNLIQIWRKKKDDRADPAKERRAWDKETDTTSVSKDKKESAED